MTEYTNIAKLIESEARKNGYLYSSYPYACGIAEAVIHTRCFVAIAENISIKTDENMTIIAIKPTKGSGRRKIFEIRLW